MKYIDAEKLLAEIVRLRKEHTTIEYRDEAALVLEDLEDYIDSIQQEMWKPSEEQIKALKYAAYHMLPGEEYRDILFSLLKDLTKLM